MDREFLVAFEYYKVMSVSFMVTEKQVLAVGGVDFFPVFQCKLDGREWGMMMGLEVNAVSFKEFLYFFCLFVYHKDLFE